MERKESDNKMIILLLCGIAGCIFMAAGDWLMIYGDTSYGGQLAWLTRGVAAVEPWRNSLAMYLAFPAVVFYSIALLGIRQFFTEDVQKKRYSFLTVTGLTPWLCLHLLYVVIFYLFAWLQSNGHEELSFQAAEAVFAHFAWIVPAAEVLMLLPFIYLFYQCVKRRTEFSRWMALNNPLLIYAVLKVLVSFVKDIPARLAFVNGLMSESMLIWFTIFIIYLWRQKSRNLC